MIEIITVTPSTRTLIFMARLLSDISRGVDSSFMLSKLDAIFPNFVSTPVFTISIFPSPFVSQVPKYS